MENKRLACSGQRLERGDQSAPSFPTRYVLRANRSPYSRGFTLIEMLVSIALFAVVMVVCVGALLSLVTANKKAQALESVMNNLNISLDDMVRAVREGSTFECGPDAARNDVVVDLVHGNADCPNGDTTFSFAPYGSDTTNAAQRTIYRYDSDTHSIQRSVAGGEYTTLTDPEVDVTSMEFYVVGTQSGDATQPRVIITIDGTAGGGNAKTETTFHLQANALQRVLDL